LSCATLVNSDAPGPGRVISGAVTPDQVGAIGHVN